MAKRAPVVLIVEDNPDTCSLIAGILHLKGFAPLKAHTVKECLDLLAEQGDQIDAVALNGDIAEENGGMIVSRTKKANPNIKTLVIVEEESDRAAIMRLGADQVAVKPLSSETVADKLTLLLAANGVLVEAGGSGK